MNKNEKFLINTTICIGMSIGCTFAVKKMIESYKRISSLTDFNLMKASAVKVIINNNIYSGCVYLGKDNKNHKEIVLIYNNKVKIIPVNKLLTVTQVSKSVINIRYKIPIVEKVSILFEDNSFDMAFKNEIINFAQTIYVDNITDVDDL